MDDIKLSKKLSFKLRHDPTTMMDEHGWASVKDMLTELRINKTQLDHIIETNNKKRFEYDSTGKKIRARQGHSLADIDLGYEPKEPPEFLYHGTASRFMDSIYKEGLKRMDRHHVHLSEDYETALKVGQRHGKPVVLKILAQDMAKEGFKFFKTDNNVWLVDEVPSKFFTVDYGAKT